MSASEAQVRDHASTEGPATRSSTLLGFLTSVGALVVLEVVNRANGDRLATYFEEYAGGGSSKWRGADGQRFQTILLVTLLLAFFALPVVVVQGARWYRATSSRNERLAALVSIVLALAVVGRFLWLRVPAAAFELG